MFSFRRKTKKDAAPPPVVRASPSLPTLTSEGIPWPENLVDAETMKEVPTDAEGDDTVDSQSTQQHQHHQPTSVTSKVSMQSGGEGHHHHPAARASAAAAATAAAIPFHKPFRPSESSHGHGGGAAVAEGAATAGSISALYMTAGGAPPSFEPKRATVVGSSAAAGRYSQRRARVPPTFNLMVVGGKGTGKTSLLRLLLETADISPAATVDQKAALDSFLKGSTKSTQAIQTACVEICESRFDRVLFSVIDTPGLDFQEGRELKLERQVNTVIKYLDLQYADTMSEESKVVRQNKGDQHVHLCIYLIDPASVTTAEERRPPSSPGFPTKTRSETTVSQSTVPDLVADTSSDDDDEDEDEAKDDADDQEPAEEVLSMSPAEIRVIRRISARANILPVIARSDSLTDEKLRAIKKAVRTGLVKAGIDFGVFAPPEAAEPVPETPTPRRKTKFVPPPVPTAQSENGDAEGIAPTAEKAEDAAAPSTDDATTAQPISTNGHAKVEDQEDGSEDEERVSRPVIKLRPKRHGRPLSRSRSRRDLSQVAEADERRPSSPDSNDRESVANVRFSAYIVAKSPIDTLFPFALIAPETGRPRPKAATSTGSQTPVVHSENGGEATVPPTPSTKSMKNVPFLVAPPEDLKGVFVRKYRWGTIDVLNPDHCDFAAMRTAVLSTHFKLLKIRTKEVLYEKYRTEKLLARRATAQISEEQRQRLLEDLGL